MVKIASELENVTTVAIAGHVRPDGDCIGSCMGLYIYLKENYPQIHTDIYLEKIRDGFEYIPYLDEIQTSCNTEKTYDVFFSLDNAATDRIGVAAEAYKKAKRTICIDHHISNRGFADVNVIEPDASSASEVLYGLLEKEKISKNTAAALYTGIAHDTGVFLHSCTSPKTMRIAADLMETGIEFTDMIQNSFYKKSYVQNQILGRCLMESLHLLNGKCIVGYVRRKDMDFYGVTPAELDGIVDQLKNTAGIEVAVFIYEVKSQEYKVSMRATGKVDVSKIASYFGGGGHVKAAGCTMQGSYYDVLTNILGHIERQIEEKEL